MAKILVADDNSNIQKMVGLALKDQGIDVVAVGNGEAAVRKISDVRPDLVLADVFMPVRNGYEVCNYVKQDSALSHIPVILLVGAFDPLDEQEAQRVGADGVLKKPFVPPDPLISMVKSALTRAGVVLGAPETAVPPPPPPASNGRSAPPPLPRVVPPPPPPPPASQPEPDFGVASFSRPAPVSIGKGEQPLAFGSLLNTQTQEEDAAFATTSRNTAIPERDWGHSATQEEEEVEEDASQTGSWRLSSMDEVPNEAPAGQTDWREAAFAGIGTDKGFKEWAPSVEKNSLAITEEEAAELAKAHEPLPVPTGVTGAEDWSKAIRDIFPEKEVAQPEQESAPAVGATQGAEEPVPALSAALASIAPIVEPAPSAPTPSSAAPTEPAASEPPDANSWMAGAVSPWEAELQRASDLASSWDTVKLAPAAVADTEATQAFLDSGLMATAHEHVVEAVEEVKAEAEELHTSEPTAGEPAPLESLYSPTEHQVKEEAPVASVTSEATVELHEAAEVEQPSAVANEPAPVPTPSTNSNMDELVAKVLAKMNPDVLQAVTREILKPVVEALIKDELNKK